MRTKSLMSTSAGVTPYPKFTGARFGKQRKDVVTQTEDNSMKCSTCGMGKDENPAHGDSYSEAGKHKYSSSSKSMESQWETFFDYVQANPEISLTGSALKALGDGKVGGWAILHTTDSDPDTTDDFFDNTTDYFLEVEPEQKAARPVIYDHGLDATLKSRRLSRGTVEVKDAGIWFETQLALRDDYEKAIYELAKLGKLGISTGSAPHLIKREQVGKAMHIKSWPIVEISLTPMPVEPRTEVVALKSYADSHSKVSLLESIKADYHKFEKQDDSTDCAECDASMDDGYHTKSVIDDSMKSMFEQALAKKTQSKYDLDSALNCVLKEIIAAEQVSDVTGMRIDRRAKVTEAVTEYAARFISLALEQMQQFMDGEYGDYGMVSSGSKPEFYLRSFYSGEESPLETFLSMKSALGSEANLYEHSSLVVSALDEYATETASLLEGVKSWEERCKAKIEFRADDPSKKSGRVISASTLTKLGEAHEKLPLAGLQELHTRLGGLLELAAPTKSIDANQLTMQIELAMAQHRNEMAGLAPR